MNQEANTPTTPVVSIIVPTYNRAHLISECIGDVIAQTFTKWELLLVDDGSTDNTAEVAATLAQQSEGRLTYLPKENGGSNKARNYGAERARGQYLIFFDSDDRVSPDWLENFMAASEGYTADLVSCGVRKMGKDGVMGNTPPFSKWRNLLYVASMLAGAFMVRRELFMTVGAYDEVIPAGQHTELGYRLFPYIKEHNLKVTSTDKPGLTIVVRPGASITKNHTAVYQGSLYTINKHRDLLLTFKDDTLYEHYSAAGVRAVKAGKVRQGLGLILEAAKLKPFSIKSYLRIFYHAFSGVKEHGVESLR